MRKNSSNVALADPNTNIHGVKRPLSEQEIALRAHEIFQQRGGTDGRDLDDWLQAERELSNGHRS